MPKIADFIRHGHRMCTKPFVPSHKGNYYILLPGSKTCTEKRFSALICSLKLKLLPDPTPQFMLLPCDVCTYHIYFACFASQSVLFLWIY